MTTKEKLNTAIDDLYNPYPSFANEGTLNETIQNLKGKHKDIIEEAGDMDTFGLEVYEDISDDISNCGRNPLAKFIEQVEFLAIIKQEDPSRYEDIIDYIANAIDSEND